MLAVLRRIRPLVLVTCVALVLGSAVTARQALSADPGALPLERIAHGEDSSSLRSFVLEGQVLEPDGAPAEGAVVVTSEGGQAVADAEGMFRLEVDVPVDVKSVQVTAVGRGGGKLLASRSIGVLSGSPSVVTLWLSQGGSCPPSWLPTFGAASGTDQDVRALVVFDDGNGAALYAAGSFDVPFEGIVKWDGTSWSNLGNGLPSFVHALAVFDDGEGEALYAGGEFLSPASKVAKWDGAIWSALGSGLNDTVFELAVFDGGGGDALFAGGNFTTAGGVAASRIAMWDGASWTALSSGVNSTVLALEVFDDGGGPALYAGGFFTTAGGASANRVARWNGANWSSLGVGTNNPIRALAVYDDGGGPSLYAGGIFTTAGGVAASRIARWDGTSWSALGSGTNGEIRALEVFDDGGGAELYAAGDFTAAGGSAASRIAKWDGATWSALGSGVNDTVHALAVFDDGSGERIHVGGEFESSGGAAASHIAKWDGAGWAGLGNGMNDFVHALAVFDDGGGDALYAAGDFIAAGSLLASHVAKWDGAGWSALGSGTNAGAIASVVALAVFDDGGGDALYAGGGFSNAGGMAASHIAKWDGASWSALGSGVTGGIVNALAVFDDGGGEALYVGGAFTTAGGTAASRIAKWDGASWSALGSGVSSSVLALMVFDDGGGAALYAGGGFTTAGGMPASRIARWDGAGWSALGSGVGGTVAALTVFDDGGGEALYAGGSFGTIAKWDGTSWTALGSGLNNTVRALSVFDDGGGAALYAGGIFTTAGGAPASRIAKWDGAGWSALGSGVSSDVRALSVFDDGAGEALYAGGTFLTALDSGDGYLAKWGPTLDTTPPAITCPADVTAECTSPAGAPVGFTPTATDDCDPSPGVVCVPTSGSTFPMGTTTVTCTATDLAGNSSMCTFDVTVEDTTPPDLACPGDITRECTNPAGEAVTFSPTATDLCDPSPSVVAVPPSGSTFALGTTIVTVTATDDSGNQSMCTFSVIVEDTTDPLVVCPGNFMVECAGGGTQVSWSASASDACDPAPAVSCSPPSGSLFGLGTTIVTCTATDASGNAAMCSFDVTVVDTTDPSVTCPADVFMECADPDGEVVSFSVSATDGCDPAPGVSCVPASGSLFPIGTTTVTCTATDASGNTDVCTFDVTLSDLDTTPPSISCPTNMTVQCTSLDGAVVTFTTTASDACDPSPLVVCSPPSGSLFPFGTTPVSCTATDAASNSAMCSFFVTVQDTTPPVVHCPSNLSVPAGTQAFWSASATDNCGGSVGATCSPPSGSFFPSGPTTVTCMATDSSGNTGFCTFTVTGIVSADVPALGPGWVALLALAALGLGLTLRRQI